MISTGEFELPLAIAKQSGSEFHMVSVRDIDYAFEFIEDVGRQQGRADDAWTQYYGSLAQWQQAKPSSFAATP